MFFWREDLACSSVLPLESLQKGGRRFHENSSRQMQTFAPSMPLQEGLEFPQKMHVANPLSPVILGGVCPRHWLLAAVCAQSTLQRAVRPG